jgi:hypothetical protein
MGNKPRAPSLLGTGIEQLIELPTRSSTKVELNYLSSFL